MQSFLPKICPVCTFPSSISSRVGKKIGLNESRLKVSFFLLFFVSKFGNSFLSFTHFVSLPKRFAIVFQKFPAFPNFYVIRPCHNSMKMPSLGMFAFSCAHFCNEILFEGIIRSFLAYFRSGCKFLGQKFIQETNSTFVNQCHFLIWHHLTIVYEHNNFIVGLSG